jgi:hypothetical protein
MSLVTRALPTRFCPSVNAYKRCRDGSHPRPDEVNLRDSWLRRTSNEGSSKFNCETDQGASNCVLKRTRDSPNENYFFSKARICF